MNAVCNKTHRLLAKSATYLLDVPTWNDYTGTWHTRDRTLLPGYLEAIGKAAPGRPLLITEAGVCEPSFSGGDLFRVDEMVYHVREWQRHPFVIGYIYFCLNDYRTDVGEEGFGVNRIRRHGLADKRLVPKDSYGLFASLASPVEIRTVKATDRGNRRVKVEIGVRDTIPCHAVRGYSLAYARADGTPGVVRLPDLQPGASHALVLDDINDEYHFEIRRPTGDVCVKY